jgi:hypothetical protein
MADAAAAAAAPGGGGVAKAKAAAEHTVLEEDDEFQEFEDEGVHTSACPVPGAQCPSLLRPLLTGFIRSRGSPLRKCVGGVDGGVCSLAVADWGHADEDAEDAKLWQDNWDDDDVTGEFSQALRAAVEKASGGAVATAGAPAGAAPGATGK